MDKKVRQVILVKNTEVSDSICASVVTRPTIEDCAQVLSHPTINWFDELNPDILGTTFTLSPVIVCDISDVEERYHRIYPTSKYDINEYYDATMPKILTAIEDTYVTSNEATHIIGEWINPVVTYIDLKKTIGPMGRMLPSFDEVIRKKGITHLVYFFNHIDRSTTKYTKKRGMCTYSLSDGDVQSFYSIEDFLRSLGSTKYGFLGELDRFNNCSSDANKVTDELNAVIKEQIEMVMIPSYDRISDDYKAKLEAL